MLQFSKNLILIFSLTIISFFVATSAKAVLTCETDTMHSGLQCRSADLKSWNKGTASTAGCNVESVCGTDANGVFTNNCTTNTCVLSCTTSNYFVCSGGTYGTYCKQKPAAVSPCSDTDPCSGACTSCISSHQFCSGTCKLKRLVTDSPIIPSCTTFNQCSTNQECTQCSAGKTLCSSRNNSSSSTPGAEACVTTRSCPLGQTFDACSDTCQGSLFSLKLDYDSGGITSGTTIKQSAFSSSIFNIAQNSFIGIGTSSPSTFLSFLTNSSGLINMGSGRIVNLSDPIDDTDAVTKGYADGLIVDTVASSSFWQLLGNNIYYNGGSVGIGTNNPMSKFDVNGAVSIFNNLSVPSISNNGSGSIFYGPNNAISWNVQSGSFTNNNAVAPDSSNTAATLNFTAGNGAHWDLYKDINGLTPGTSYTLSIYVKLGTATNFGLVVNDQSSWNTVGGKMFTAADGLSATAWKEVSYTFIQPSGKNSINLHIGANEESALNSFPQTAGTVYIWGVKVVQNSPSSLILQPNSGNIGIGTTTPIFKLDVNGQGRFIGNTAATPALRLGTGTGGIMSSGTNDIALVSNSINVATFVAASATDVRFQINTTNYSTMFGQYEGNWFGVINPMIMQPLSPATAHDIAITGTQNNPSNGIVIKAAGGVGIGTTNPGSFRLNVTGNVLLGVAPASSIYTVAPLNMANNGAGLKPQLNLINGNGGGGTGSAIDFYTYTDAGNGLPGSRFGSIDDGNYSGHFVFLTKANSSNGALTEKIRITSGGYLGIGSTTPSTFLSFLTNSSGLINMGSGRIVNLSDPIDDADAVTKGYADDLVASTTAAITTIAKFVGVTPSRYYGNNSLYAGDAGGYATSTGYMAANDICNNSFSGSHICTSEEILNTINTKSAMPTEPISWIFNGPPGYTTEANDCDGRTKTTGAFGAVWQIDSSKWPNGRGMLTACQNYNKFACCK